MQKFDVLVIGAGSGLDVANSLAQHGCKVAIIERDKMGGTCLNSGCIPSKLLLHSADVMETIRNSSLFGINVEKLSVDFQKIVKRVNNLIDNDSNRIKRQFKHRVNPKLFSTECKFVDIKTIILNDTEERLTAEKILIAAGSRPTIPNIKGLRRNKYVTSDEALRLKVQPKVLTIIGGGFIACELAHFFGSLGTEINIIQNKDRLIAREDLDISKKVTEIFSKKFNVYLNCTAESISRDRKIYHVIATDSKNKKVKVISDQLLVAVGRTPNSDILDLERTNVRISERGYILTNEYLETNVSGIFALGDIAGHYQFKHSANLEAQYAYHNIMNSDKMIAVDYRAMPHAIFSSPQVATVGYTEQELLDRQINYKKSLYKYIDTAMGKAIGDKDGFVKFLVNTKDRKILGCHILGSYASILIHEVIPIMKGSESSGNQTIDSIARAVHIHPALSEVIARAAYELV